MDSNLEYTASDYVAALRRRRGLLVAVALPIIAGAALLAAVLPDKYTSYAQIDINLEGSNVRTLAPIEVTSYADQYIAKLTDLALSRDNMLALAADSSVISATQSGLTESEIVEEIKNSIQVSVLTQMVLSPSSGREVDLISGFQVASVSSDPEFVYQVANYVARLFLDADRLSRTERASSTSLFLSEQMNQTESEIVVLEKEVAAFKVANACCLPELVDLNTSAMQRAERDIESSQPRIRALEQDRIFRQTQLDELGQSGAETDRVSELQQEYMTLVAKYGANHPDVNRLRREIIALTNADSESADSFEIIELRIKLGEAEQRYSSQHPDVIRYKSELAALESRTAARGGGKNKLLDNPRYLQLRADLNSIDSQLTELRSSQPVLRQKIAEYESRLARTPQVESEYEAINRKLQSTRDNFDDLQRRSIIAEQSEALESTDIGARLVQVVAPVVPGSPSGPPRTAILVLGIFLAVTLGVGSMLFAEMTDSTIRGSKDIAMVINMVPLATIPVIENLSSRKQYQRKLYLIRGTTLVVITAIVLYYFRDFF
ncbi:MAG: Wzz/FepE/Etk N-terminal domain-containing protein [Woeseiaceae bacterium]|nr:Wzz/FepE/Etk N-terminal domain-containing protein [Woeseiaceae bacterium]